MRLMTTQRKTIYLFRKFSPINLVPLLGGQICFFYPPLTYRWLSGHADHRILWIQMTSSFTKQLLPCYWYYWLENSCYPNSSLPGTFLYQSIIFSACAPCLSYYSPKYISLLYSDPPGGWVFLWFRTSSRHRDSGELFTFGRFCRQLLRHFPANIWRFFQLSSFSLHDLTFSLILNAFNIRESTVLWLKGQFSSSHIFYKWFI